MLKLKVVYTYQVPNNVSTGDAPLYTHLECLVRSEGGLVPGVAPLYAVAFVVHVYIQMSIFVEWHCKKEKGKKKTDIIWNI